MEPNNFEKNVQQKLDELKIPPSDGVWTNVEKRIGKKHKDRRVIFILFFIILFLLSGGYWLMNLSKSNKKRNQQISNIVTKERSSKQTLPTGRQANSQDSSFSKSMISSAGNSDSPDTASAAAKKYKITTTPETTVLQDKSVNARINKKQKRLSEEADFKSQEKILKASENKSRDSKATNNEENEIVLNNRTNFPVNKPNISEIENKNEKTDSVNTIQNKISNDSLLNQLKPENTAKEIIAKNDSSLKKHSENRQKKHWAFGITFSGGASMIVENPFGTDKVNYASVQNTPGTGNNPPVYLPSKINGSVAFIGGVFVEKNISSKTKISLGISYKYFSLINKIGNRIDPVSVSSQYSFSSSNFYSSTNTQGSYRNNFHYLELPVSAKFQLNNSKSFPLYWHAGINISQLIASNALQFQSTPGLYYNDNSLFNKTQFGLSTGLSATFFAKQKVPVTIGPYFYYDASKLAGKGLYEDQHFSFIGIRAEFLFKKK